MAIFLLILVMVFALAGLVRPFYGLLGLLVVNVLQPGELYPSLAPLHLERTLAIILLFCVLLHRKKLRFPKITLLILVFYAAMWLAVPLAFWRGNSIAGCIDFGPIVVYHLLIVALIVNTEEFHKYLILGMFLVAWLGGAAYWRYEHGIVQVAMDIDRAIGITSSGGDANTLGITLVCSLPLLFLLTTKDNSWWMRILAWSVMTLSVATVIDTGSRTSFFVFILFVVLTLMRQKKYWKFLPLLPLAGFLLWAAIPQQYKARYETVDHLKNDESYQNRVLSWEGGVQMFLSNPLTGIGPDNYAIANGEKFWPGFPRHWLQAHSLYFQLLGELGLLGMITWYSFLITLIALNFRLSRKMKDNPHFPSYLKQFPGMCNIAIFILLVASYSAHTLYRETWYSLAALSGVVQYLAVKKESIEDAEPEEDRPNPLLIPLPKPSLKAVV
ncbi:MAG TPA: O-antigen ligase family protein [Acidobacteriaceae bacterium]|jgi:hypothetical protein|nr:O-antigen ligase family protein [Acidobacteriaceae bacterium]